MNYRRLAEPATLNTLTNIGSHTNPATTGGGPWNNK